MKKYFREMDTSNMPMSKNIVDRRTPDRKADDAKLKPGQDKGDTDGPSHSWMRSPQDYGTYHKPNFGYQTGPENLRAPKPKHAPDPTVSNIQRQDKSALSEPVKTMINGPDRLNIKEHCGCDVIQTIKKVVKKTREKEKLNKK